MIRFVIDMNLVVSALQLNELSLRTDPSVRISYQQPNVCTIHIRIHTGILGCAPT